MSRNIDLGSLGEEEACRFLKKHGWKVLARNYRTPRGEIDIIASCGDVIVFAEVKTRTKSDYAQPWEAVGFRKRNHLKQAARIYVSESSPGDFEYRFDVLSILLDEDLKATTEWIQNAF